MLYLSILVGILLSTMGMKGVLLPLNVNIGGFAGISQLMHHFWGLQYSVSSFLLNAIFFVWAAKRHGTKRVSIAILTTLAFNIILDYVPEYSPPLMTDLEQFIAICVGAVVTGLGFGCILRSGSTVGGSDYLAELITLRFPAISRGAVGTIINLLIVFSTAAFFGIDSVFKAITATVLVNESVNITLYGFSEMPIPKSLQLVFSATKRAKATIANFFARWQNKSRTEPLSTFVEDQIVTLRSGHQLVTLKVISITND